jgi:hypothetical protein
MRFLQPKPTPYDPYALMMQPFSERARQVCQDWALTGHGAPAVTFVFYVVKILFYIAVWFVFCGLTPSLGGPLSVGSWWAEPIAFQKAVLWSMLFEGMGLGCGSGPLTGRYMPPFGGFLYFLRPGTTKLALWKKLPLFGGIKRTWLDVALYAGLLISLLRALIAPEIEPAMLWPIIILIPLASIGDRMQFLVFRSEHYWTLCCCFALANPWFNGAKCVWLALWFWAGISKLNHHFPNVVQVMLSNSPVLPFQWLRKAMYRKHPEDLTPSPLAQGMAHAGTVLELGVPTLMLLTPLGEQPVAGIIAMLFLHGFITSNFPMGVPLEWNVMMVYGGFVLFWAHPEVAAFTVTHPALIAILVLMLVLLPLLGNLFPEKISFLLSMRYYAGNWACSVWFLRLDAFPKFDKLKAVTRTIDQQLGKYYDAKTMAGMFARGLGFRLMHLHGRALIHLLPKTIENELHYAWVDGEGMAGNILGWNFGDGHLHDEDLLAAVQEQCKFEPGEIRCIFVESQPLGRNTLSYRIADAASGVIEHGEVSINTLRSLQPWGQLPVQPSTDPLPAVANSGAQ